MVNNEQKLDNVIKERSIESTMRNQCNSPPLLELYWNWLPFSMYSMYRYWQVVCMCMYWSKWGCRNSTFHTYAWRMVWTYYDMLMAELVLAWVPGVPGTCIILGFTAWHPRILADQLTLLKPGGQIMPTTLLHTWEPQLLTQALHGQFKVIDTT